MKESGQLHAVAALPLGNDPHYLLNREVVKLLKKT